MLPFYLFTIIFFLVYSIIAVYLGYTIYAMLSGAPFVPTKPDIVERMLTLAELKAGERLMDIGSGDGRIVFAAAVRGAYCVGIEINPLLYWKSRWTQYRQKIKNVEFRRENLWDIDLSDVDVLTLFFIHHKMEKMKQKILREMKPGSRVVSQGFYFPDWQYAKKDGKVYLYFVQK